MAVSMEGTVELLDSLQALSLGETGAAAKEPAERIIECQVISWNKSELSIQCACCDSVHSTAFSGYESNNYEGTFCPKSKKRYIPVFPDCFEANKDTGTLLKLHEGDPPKQWSLEADTEEKVLLADAGDTLGDPCLKIIAMIRHELRATNEKLEQIDRIKYHNTTMLRNLRKQKIGLESIWKTAEEARSYQSRLEEPLTQPPKPVETQFSTAITHRPEILFVKSRRNGEVRCLEEIARIPPDMRLRTAAHLVRGRDYPNVLAASGYAGEWWRFTTANMLWHPPDLLDNVKTLMEEVNHEIIWDPKARWARPGDAESRKNYYACHAEKQLITYFVRKHVITPKDRERLYPISRKQEKLDDASKEAKSEPTASPSMVKALDLPLPSGSLTSATITVSREMCLDWR